MPAKPLVIGHRGAAGHAPENTLAAFRAGLALRADGVECDVHMSRDGELVVIHDDRLDRTTDGHGRVGAQPWAALRALDAGSWYGPAFAGERLPTLGEVCALLRDHERKETRLFVELKHGDDVYPGIEGRLAGILAESGLAERATVIGFDHRAIARLQKRAPELATGVLFDARPLDAARLAMETGSRWLCPSLKWVDAELVAQARAAGREIFVWTANEAAGMGHVIALGASAAGSDYPDRLLAMRAAASAG